MRLSLRDRISLYALAGRNALGILGAETFPPAVIWVLTRRCFYRCLHCDSWRDETPIDPAALDVIAGRIVEAPTKLVALSGGEPLMVRSLPAIVARLRASGKWVSINTNGHLLEEHAGWIAAEEVSHVQVSIDGHHAELHDAIRRQRGSFDRILRGIEAIKARRSGRRPRISVCATLMKENAEHVVDLVERFQRSADAVELQPVHDSPGLLATAGAKPWGPGDRERVRDQLDRLFERFPSFDDPYHDGFERFLFEPASLEREATDHCMPMIFNTLTIRDRGECFVCRYPLGEDLLSRSVSQVWNGDARWNLHRRLARLGCQEPCWLRCNHHRSPLAGRLLKKTAAVW